MLVVLIAAMIGAIVAIAMGDGDGDYEYSSSMYRPIKPIRPPNRPTG